MPRVYTVQFDQVAVTAAQDLICIYSATLAAGKTYKLLRCVINNVDSTIPTSQTLGIQVKVLTGTVTAGTGGAAATPQKIDPGDAAATFTARVNDVTTAASGTTSQIAYDGGFHVFTGMDEGFVADQANPRGAQPVVSGALAAGSAGSAAIAIHLMNAPIASLHLSGTAWIEETG